MDLDFNKTADDVNMPENIGKIHIPLYFKLNNTEQLTLLNYFGSYLSQSAKDWESIVNIYCEIKDAEESDYCIGIVQNTKFSNVFTSFDSRIKEAIQDFNERHTVKKVSLTQKEIEAIQEVLKKRYNVTYFSY